MSGEITWKAVYDDDTFLNQYSEDGQANGYDNIDRSRLAAFELWKDNALLFRMELKKDQKLIYRKRVKVKGMSGNISDIVYIIGWHKKDKDGKSIKKIAFVNEDGSVEFKPEWEESNRWHSKPKLRDDEK